MAPETDWNEVADRLVEWALADERVRALWLEAPTLEALRRPYGELDVHIAADEPVFPGVLDGLESDLERVLGATVEAIADTRRFAKELTVGIGGQRFRLVAEQSHLLAKRPRAEVVPLLDRTGHLPHVLDYSLRAR